MNKAKYPQPLISNKTQTTMINPAINQQEPAAFKRGTGDWEGVVMIERPDLQNLPYGCDPMCRVMSARTIQLNGQRAIYAELPYSMLKDFFKSDDGDHCFVEAEFKDGHLEFYKRSNSVLGDWVLYSMTQEQKSGVH